MREYFVSYYFAGRKGDNGYGQMSINRPTLIRGCLDLQEIAEFIRQKNKFKSVVILNWRRYEQPEALIGFGGVR